MTKNFIVRVFEPGNILGTFGIGDNPYRSSVTEDGDTTTVNIPLQFALACVKAAGYKVFREV